MRPRRKPAGLPRVDAEHGLSRFIDEITTDNPWYNTRGEIHRRRFLIVTAVERQWPERAAWVTIVLDRAFYQAFQYAAPDELAEHLESILAEALQHKGSDALHMAGQLMREKAMALGIPERDW